MHTPFKRFLLIGAALVLLAGCKASSINLGAAADAGTDAYKAASLNPEELKRDSKLTAAEMDRENRVAPAGNAYAKRLQKLTAGLTREDGLDLNFKVYLTSDVNAFALPDGSIRVYSGLMDLLKNDDELLSVVGHEIGHVKLGHSANRFRVAYAASAARKGAAAAGGVAGSLSRSELGAIGQAFINAQFSQSQESASDEYGFNLLKKYGRNTGAAESALRKMASLGGSSGLLSSHPDPNKRADRMAKLNNK